MNQEKMQAIIEAKKNSDALWEEILIVKEKELHDAKSDIERLRGAVEQIERVITLVEKNTDSITETDALLRDICRDAIAKVK